MKKMSEKLTTLLLHYKKKITNEFNKQIKGLHVKVIEIERLNG